MKYLTPLRRTLYLPLMALWALSAWTAHADEATSAPASAASAPSAMPAASAASSPASAAAAMPVASAASAAAAEPPANASQADNTAAYRRDAAKHVYEHFRNKIYKGKLPPLVHAIVVTEVTLDEMGQVSDINMVRIPSHAPDVTVAVKSMIRELAPWPAPYKMGGVTFSEVWMVDKSGKFQLHTLTEGQR